ncbi:MAG: 3'-5' exonuclease, partial [Halothiobacillaceae bacterium]
ARTNQAFNDFEQDLKDSGLETIRLSREQSDNRSQPGIRLATMHRVKGLEFRHVFIMGADDHHLPLKQAMSSTQDQTERCATELSERALLHVAVTRAIQSVAVTWSGNPSPFLAQKKNSNGARCGLRPYRAYGTVARLRRRPDQNCRPDKRSASGNHGLVVVGRIRRSRIRH